MNLERVRELIVEFGLSRGLDLECFDDWKADYTKNWNDSLSRDLQNFADEMQLFRSAKERNDKVTQLAALVTARSFLMNLEGFFRGLREDIEKIVWSRIFEWPQIPEDYTIPDHYEGPGHVKRAKY